MPQVFLTTASTSPWTVPRNFAANLSPTVWADTTAQAMTDTRTMGDFNNFQVGETFVAPVTGTGLNVSFVISKVGNPTDNVKVEFTDSTLGTVLATSGPLAGSLITGTPTTYTFTPGSTSFNSGTTYGVVLQRSGSQDVSNYYVVSGNASSAAASVYKFFNGTIWTTNSPADDNMDLNFKVFGGTSAHTVELVSCGGNGAAGTSGSGGSGGGGGGGGGYLKLMYMGGSIIGGTTIPFAVPAGGSGNPALWEDTSTASGIYYICTGATTANGVSNGFSGGGGNVAFGSPPVIYGNIASHPGNSGGSSGKNLGGGGGAGAGGPITFGGSGGVPTTTAGGGGGGANNSSSGNAPGGASISGGQGSTGTPATTSGSTGSGDSGGAGGPAIATAGFSSVGGDGGNTDTAFDSTHGMGGGGAGSGAMTATGASTLQGGNAGFSGQAAYGSGGGGCGYGNGTPTFVVGLGNDGLIVINYALAPFYLSGLTNVNTVMH